MIALKKPENWIQNNTMRVIKYSQHCPWKMQTSKNILKHTKPHWISSTRCGPGDSYSVADCEELPVLKSATVLSHTSSFLSHRVSIKFLSIPSTGVSYELWNPKPSSTSHCRTSGGCVALLMALETLYYSYNRLVTLGELPTSLFLMGTRLLCTRSCCLFATTVTNWRIRVRKHISELI